jgi:protein gp37
MGTTTGIAWTHHTFNPWRGCTKIAPECAHCYADDTAKRNPKVLGVWGPQGKRVMGAPAYWKEPLKWNREAEKAGERRRVFCASMADVFENWQGEIHNHHGEVLGKCSHCGNLESIVRRAEWTPGEPEWLCRKTTGGCGQQQAFTVATLADVRHRLFKLIDVTPWLDWLLLTKRPENIPAMWPRWTRGRWNCWLGTSAGCQATADKAIPHLLKCRDLAPVLFVSCEPMLDAVQFDVSGGAKATANGQDVPVCGFCGVAYRDDHQCRDGINWLIIGVESNGPRIGNLGDFPNEAAWLAHATKLVEQAQQGRVPVFVKQLPINGRLSHDPAEWPAALRVQQFPGDSQ